MNELVMDEAYFSEGGPPPWSPRWLQVRSLDELSAGADGYGESGWLGIAAKMSQFDRKFRGAVTRGQETVLVNGNTK